MTEIMKTALRIIMMVISLLLLIWAFYPEGRAIAAGLIVGLVASLVNGIILQRKIERLTQTVLDESAPRMKGIGLGSRVAMVLVVAMIGYRFPDHINLPAALAACFIVPLMAPAAAMWQLFQEGRRKG